ncbi:hypothetical protein HZ994_11300 [Akkermansiaceae bacterium]|nr:hypothetical protein HZ994_11300 [Akkermansiaceae bacterium]
MITEIHPDTPINQLPQAARETAQHAIDATKDAAHRATDAAKDMYQSAATKASDTLAISKDYVRRNPLPVVLGAVAHGAAIGYILLSSRRKPTFGERFADEPLASVREAILSALTPMAQGVHEGYDSARDSVGKAMHQARGFGVQRSCGNLSDRLCRVGSNLKFW